MSESLESGTPPAEELPPPAATEALAAEAPPSEPAEPAPEPPPAPKREPWWDQRIRAQAAKLAHETEQRTRLERELEHLRALQQPPAADPAQQRPPQAPDIERIVNERIAQAEAQRTQRAQQEALASVIRRGEADYTPQAFTDACNTLAALGANEKPAFMEAITDLEDSHKVLNHLGNNPEEAARILALPPTKMAMALARLNVAPKPAAAPVSRAPAPIRPIEGSARVEVDPDKMDVDAYMKWREKTAQARR